MVMENMSIPSNLKEVGKVLKVKLKFRVSYKLLAVK